MSDPQTTVLVTGASSGIGQATARLLAAEGFDVYGTSRRPRPDGHGVRMLELDIRSDDSVARCVTELLDRAGGLDVLVNNAGAMHEGFVEETTLAEAADVFDINFFGTARVINAVLPGMRGRRRGRIVNVGSLAACVGEPGEGYYAASKAALARYTEALRHEVWHCGIRVSLVEPAAFATSVLGASTAASGRIGDYDGPRESAHRTLHESMRRGDDPRRAARVVLRAVRDRRPRLRYGAGREAAWVPRLRAALPQRTFDRLLRRGFGLPR